MTAFGEREFNAVSAWLRGTKSASENGVAASGSTHPTESLPTGDVAATDGARNKEHDKALAEQQPQGVGKAAEGTNAAGSGAGGLNSPEYTMNNKVSLVGDSPQAETEATKRTKDDPGTASEASTEKASAIVDRLNRSGARITAILSEQLAAPAAKQASSSAGQPAAPAAKEASADPAAAPAAAPASAPTAKAAAEDEMREVGRTIVEQALEKSAAEQLAPVIREAKQAALRVAEFLRGVTFKQAMDGELSPEETAMLAESDPAFAAMLQEQAGGAPGAAAPGAEAAPAPAGGEGMDQLVTILEEAGVSPEELMAVLQGDSAGAPAEAPAASAPPAEAAPAAEAPAESAPAEKKEEESEEAEKTASRNTKWASLSGDQRKLALRAILVHKQARRSTTK